MQLPKLQGASDPSEPFPCSIPLERGEPKPDGSYRDAPPIPSSASSASQAAEGVWKGETRSVLLLPPMPAHQNQHHTALWALGGGTAGSTVPQVSCCPPSNVLLWFCRKDKLPTGTAAFSGGHTARQSSPLWQRLSKGEGAAEQNLLHQQLITHGKGTKV